MLVYIETHKPNYCKMEDFLIDHIRQCQRSKDVLDLFHAYFKPEWMGIREWTKESIPLPVSITKGGFTYELSVRAANQKDDLDHDLDDVGYVVNLRDGVVARVRDEMYVAEFSITPATRRIRKNILS